MKFKKTFAALALAGTLFAGTAAAEPLSAQSTLGFDEKTNLIAHIDCDAVRASEVEKICKGKQSVGDEVVPEEFRSLVEFLNANSDKITSVTFGSSVDDDMPDFGAFYVRGGLKAADLVEKIKAAGIPVKSVPAGKSKKAKKVDLFEIRERDGDDKVCVCLCQVDAKTIAVAFDDGKEEKALSAIKKLLKNRSKKICAPIEFKVENRPVALVGFRAIKDNEAEIERLLFTIAENDSAFKVKAEVGFKTEVRAMQTKTQIDQMAALMPMIIAAATQEVAAKNPEAIPPETTALLTTVFSKLKISQDGRILSADSCCPIEEIKSAVEKAKSGGVREIPAADDVFVD